MFDEIKEMLVESPDHIVNILEHYGFAKVKMTQKEIRCGVEDDSNPSSVMIRLVDNPKIYVKDYGRNISDDLFAYITKIRGVTLKDVLSFVKQELGVSSFSAARRKTQLFGGVFDNIMSHREARVSEPIDEGVLNEFDRVPSQRFLTDGISIKTQKKFDIRFSKVDQRVAIPIKNSYGELIGVKGRCNYTPEENEPKYLYMYPCQMSTTLYGYVENYADMYRNTVYVFEAEKSVLQADTMGIHNAVALGSNSLSEDQAIMLLALQPSEVVFMMDNSLAIESSIHNAEVFADVDVMRCSKVSYFDWRDCDLLKEKDSPTDRGLDTFNKIRKEFVKVYREGSI